MREKWMPPNGTGWPDFCDRCGKRRQWVEEEDGETGDDILVDNHECKP